MSPSPIPKVLSTIREHGVLSLLMGGQACVLYGAAEFSRDADFAILASPDNLDRLSEAMNRLQARVIAVPPFELQFLEKGHAVHFRCNHPSARGVRIDVMSRLRGIDSFPDLLTRRTTWQLPDGTEVDSLSLPDLVISKKTQRDKDWPMVRRLVESNYVQFFDHPTPERITFWLTELRTPELLVECVTRFPDEADRIGHIRGATRMAGNSDIVRVRSALETEEAREKERDRIYWAPLRAELESLRSKRRG